MILRDLIYRLRDISRLSVVNILLCSCAATFAEENRLSQIRVGLLLVLSGPYASLGEDCRQGVEVAKGVLGAGDTLEGKEIKFFYGDTQADPKVAVNEFKKMLNVHNIHLAITLRSPIGMALNPLSARAKVPLLGAVGHTDFVPTNPFAFQLWSTGLEDGEALANLISMNNGKRVALITTEDDWTVSVSDGFRKGARRHGLTLVYDQSLLPTETEFLSVISKLRNSNSDSIIINSGITQIGPIIKKLREQGFTQQIYSTFWVAKPEVLDSAGPAALEGVKFVEASLAFPKLRAALREKFGDERISQMTYSCYAAMAFALQALADSKGISSSSDVHQSLLKHSSVNLLDEVMIMKGRKAIQRLAGKRIQAGKVIEESLLPLDNNG